MKNLFKISLLLLAFGFANSSFAQEITKKQEPVKKSTYDSKKNKPISKTKVSADKMKVREVKKSQVTHPDKKKVK